MSNLLGWFAIGSIFFGLFFMLVGTIGILRFRDVYLRLHSASKSVTFGFVFILLGSVILVGDAGNWSKALLAIGFQFLTAPVAAQVVARAALIHGIVPVRTSGEGEEIDEA
jgi:multicomponent Na+:H+ antiporter subunit G